MFSEKFDKSIIAYFLFNALGLFPHDFLITYFLFCSFK